MEHALRIDLRAEILPGPIRLDATGCLTEASGGRLLGVLDRAVALGGCPSVTVNLLGLEHLEPAGWHALARHVAALEHERRAPGQELLQVRPVINVHAPARPRHCSDPQQVKAFRDLWLEGLVDRADASPPAGEAQRRA